MTNHKNNKRGSNPGNQDAKKKLRSGKGRKLSPLTPRKYALDIEKRISLQLTAEMYGFSFADSDQGVES